MGEMPESPESEELEMEGSDFESPEAEASPVEELKSKLSELDEEGLREMEAAIATELSKLEEGMEEGESEEAEAPMEDEESSAGGLSSLFG